jgi:putative IMPACT (imprinted ancient) family translation regulator
MLKVLERHGITDVMAICARWYGGTKLGMGGLARAYSGALLGAIGEGEALGLFESIRIMAEGTIEAPQELAHLPFSLLGCFKGATIIGQEFDGAMATICFRLPIEDRSNLERAWAERSRGGKVRWS